MSKKKGVEFTINNGHRSFSYNLLNFGEADIMEDEFELY